LSALLLDTHAWAWLLSKDPRLSVGALKAVLAANVHWLSPISFFEIGQKARMGKWPEMTPFVAQLPELFEQQGGKLVNLSAPIAMRAALAPWRHRDPFDRFIAATAMELKVPLLSADTAFDELNSTAEWRGRVW
jgi:PIN domain nuclease of toxin-antitoxin system